MGFLGGISKKVSQNENFQKWFGNSVVRNEDGSPRVVYHGTGAKEKFTEFIDWRPVFFTPDKEYAKAYIHKGGGRGRVIQAYLRMEHPFDPKNDPRATRFYNEQFIPYWAAKFPRQAEKLAPLSIGSPLFFTWADQFWSFLRHWTRQHGASYDGMIVDEGGFSDREAYVPLFTWQIKSATNNVGTFDPNDPNILHGLRRRR